ncbi:hypothetical protein C8Q70DRAFT_1018812 [Cubamyces menziesii]|uniref:Probable RNA polymerase II nuclear localization protein SLC7A6OS n=1 Tax=Trametes cubensis TaxID=1111947 RepID=A0AAD7U4V2_9APHY|nr:hypothetical protein C8Q70DRAFT_1018812 [Cubamyces menziesii]KAJ8496953.1 hypothetical protein ONZ51_g809 [Trametes cubensis]
MEVDPPHALQQQQPYAILRIKRKRNEEPLDALVVDSAPRRKRSRGGLNVFQYAGTVEQAAWDDEQQKKELEERLAGLARDSTQKKPEGVAGSSTSAAAASVSAPVPAPAPASSAKPQTTQGQTTMRTHYEAPSRTYTIVPQEQMPLEHYARKQNATAPPKVYSSKEMEEIKRSAAFKMYDAVPSSVSGAVISDTDKEIEKFLPLLKDYLSVNDVAPPAPTPQTTGAHGDGMDEDYVYDVFYQRPTTFQEFYEPGSASNIAKLTGLPPELSGLYGEDESDEEYDDEDDEDSNAEDWYTNDYPEEEEPDPASSEEELSDEFHETSDYEDIMHGDDRAYRDVMTDL